MDVFHVTGSDSRDGILTPEAMRERFPEIYVAMESEDADFLQFGSDAEKSVIIKREPASHYKPEVIQSSPQSATT